MYVSILCDLSLYIYIYIYTCIHIYICTALKACSMEFWKGGGYCHSGRERVQIDYLFCIFNLICSLCICSLCAGARRGCCLRIPCNCSSCAGVHSDYRRRSLYICLLCAGARRGRCRRSLYICLSTAGARRGRFRRSLCTGSSTSGVHIDLWRRSLYTCSSAAGVRTCGVIRAPCGIGDLQCPLLARGHRPTQPRLLMSSSPTPPDTGFMPGFNQSVSVTSRPLRLWRFSGRPAGAWTSNVLFLPAAATLPPPRLLTSSSLPPPLCDFLGPPF